LPGYAHKLTIPHVPFAKPFIHIAESDAHSGFRCPFSASLHLHGILLALPLLMLWVLADYCNSALSSDYFALIAKLLY